MPLALTVHCDANPIIRLPPSYILHPALPARKHHSVPLYGQRRRLSVQRRTSSVLLGALVVVATE
jgi:hypothetical protein